MVKVPAATADAFQPVEQLAPESETLMGRVHGQQVQMGDVVAEMHDRETRQG